MALVLSTTGKYLSRNAGLLPITGDFTVMFWTFNTSAPATTPTTGWAEIDAYPLVTDGVQLSTGTHPGSFYRAEYTGGFFAQVEEWTTYYGNGVWNHHAIVYDNATGQATMYVNGSAVSVTTFSLNPLSVALEVLGNNGTSTVANHKFIYYRSWSTKLNSSEINAERLSQTVVKTASLWMDTPLTANANDISGNGRNWTVNGAVSYDASDPIAPPVSYYDITTPFSQLFTAAQFNAGTYGGVANQLWLRYISDADQVFSIGTTDPFSSGVQVPRTTIYADNGVSELASWTGVKAGGIQVLNGNTYYIKIDKNPAGAADQNFTVTADVLGYITSIPDDAVIINDDASGFPALAMTIDGTFLGYIQNIPAGEIGAILPGGISLWHNRFASSNKLRLVAADMSIISDFDLTTPLGGTFPRFANNATDFWVSDALTNSKIYKVTTAAVVTLDATLTSNRKASVIGVNTAGDILYFIDTFTSVIRAWDLTNDLDLGVFHTIAALAGVPSYRVAQTPNGHPGDILVLSNGNLVTWYRNITAGQDTIIVINSSGTLVNSFNLPSGTYEVDHISYSPNDPNAIRVWVHINPGLTTAIVGEYSLSTGAFTTSFTTDLYSELINTNALQLFGPSNSCTMVSMLAAPAPPVGTATLIITKITDPSPDPTGATFDYTTTGGLSPSTFQLQDGGTRTYSNLAAGTYGVTETPLAGWATLYAVSNGDPHDAIELEDGDTVIVTVSNKYINLPGYTTNTNSGLYKIVPEKRDDTLWESYSPKRIKLTKIPDPFIETGLIGE